MEPSRDDPADELRPEYDLSRLRGGVRGKYTRRMAHGAGYETTAGLLPGVENGKPTPDQIIAFHKQIWETLLPKFRRCVLPITASDGTNSSVLGTGTLFRVGGRSFLVSAHHVFTEAVKNDLGISIHDCLPETKTPALLLGGRVIFAPKYDVAVMELSPETVSGMPNRLFLSVHEADRANRRPEDGTYALFGFPSVQVTPHEERDLLVMPFGHISHRYAGFTNSFENYEPESHILIDGDRTRGARVDSGPQLLPSSLWGMSGCSIWQLYYPGLSTRYWTPEDAVIVGVQTGVDKNGTVFKGTRWRVVDQLIREAYPELAGPLDLHVPMSGT
ncbi:MAG TPA: hypothetical protein VH092_27460 [Urbifossiella sp.]|nr:hypothetical protein [Urbifossiella sp.]